MDINLQLHINGEKQVLRMKNVSEEIGANIVQSFFAAADLNYNAVEAQDVKIPEVNISNLSNIKLPNLDVLQEASSEKELTKSTVASEPKHWVTGIKIDEDGSKRYKCYYTCECGNKGRHYIPLETDFIECHKCGYHIDVEPAGKLDPKGIPKRDDFGNFFLAQHWK